MDNFDFSAQPDIPRDRIYVSWNEQWDLERYVDDYLATRKLRIDAEARARIRKSIAEFTGTGALRKSDVDYYLDANVRKELELPAGWGARKGRAA
jgi:hypothetical protein